MVILKKNLALKILILVCFLPLLAHAQNLPGSADAGRFNERFEDLGRVQEPDIVPPKESAVDQNIPEAEDGFELKKIVINDIRAFDRAELQPIIEPYIGRTVDLNVLNHLAARITQYYRDHGYFLSRAVIPEQEIENGEVRILIIEGYVSDVIIDDSTILNKEDFLGYTNAMIRKIKSLDPLHGPSLERYLLLLNSGAGLYVQSILEAAPSSERPGGVNIILKAEKVDPTITLGYNNHGSKFVGPHQIEGGFFIGGVFSNYDALNINAVASLPLDEVQYASLSYSIPLNAEGLSFDVSGSYSNSEPGSNLRLLDVESDSTSFRAGLDYAWIKSRKTGFDIGLDFSLRNTATEFLDEELIDDKIRALHLTGQVSHKDSWKGVTFIDAGLHKGLNILGARETGSQNLSRTQGRSDFVKATLSARRQQVLGQNFNLLGQVHGQYAPHPLLSSEEFGYGGSSLGRAYDPSEITGDQGVSAGVEVRYTGVESFHNLSLVPFTFYDIGKVWNEDRNTQPVSAASAGFGSYYNISNAVSGSASIAWPVTKSIDNPIMNEDDGPRILFELKTQF